MFEWTTIESRRWPVGAVGWARRIFVSSVGLAIVVDIFSLALVWLLIVRLELFQKLFGRTEVNGRKWHKCRRRPIFAQCAKAVGPRKYHHLIRSHQKIRRSRWNNSCWKLRDLLCVEIDWNYTKDKFNWWTGRQPQRRSVSRNCPC